MRCRGPETASVLVRRVTAAGAAALRRFFQARASLARTRRFSLLPSPPHQPHSPHSPHRPHPPLSPPARRRATRPPMPLWKFMRGGWRALSSVINIVDPDIIVLGGGLSNIERLYKN